MSEMMNFWHNYSRIIMVIISPVIPATSLAQKFFLDWNNPRFFS